MTEQTTVEKAADIAEWYFHDGSLFTVNKESKRTRFDSICETWGVPAKDLNAEMSRRGMIAERDK